MGRTNSRFAPQSPTGSHGSYMTPVCPRMFMEGEDNRLERADSPVSYPYRPIVGPYNKLRVRSRNVIVGFEHKRRSDSRRQAHKLFRVKRKALHCVAVCLPCAFLRHPYEIGEMGNVSKDKGICRHRENIHPKPLFLLVKASCYPYCPKA